jgi:hypothetical protein
MKISHSSNFFFSVVFVIVLALVAGVYAGEEKMSASDLPQAVVSAFKQSYPDATIKTVAKEEEDGTVYYEIESIDGTLGRDILYLADGHVVEIEETVTMDQLPTVVKETLTKQFPSAKVEKAEKIIRDLATTYEFNIENDQEDLEIVMDATGKILKAVESKEKEDEQEEEQEEQN